MKMNIIKSIIGLACIFVLINFIQGADSRSYPVTAAYCDGSTVDIYPFSLVFYYDTNKYGGNWAS